MFTYVMSLRVNIVLATLKQSGMALPVLESTQTLGDLQAQLISANAYLGAEALLPAFQKAAVSSAPYAYALDPSGESTLSLIEADPYRGGSPRARVAPLRNISGRRA